jgi:NADPH:quinone reductase-like Zn-dependent oxidoreductase
MDASHTSRRWVVIGRGGPEVLRLVEGPLPEPGRGEVRIQVVRAGVAFGDVMRRRGTLAPRRPFTPGYDVVGRIDATGPGAMLALGARVAAVMPRIGIGGYAEHVVVPAWAVAAIPDAVSFGDAIALGLNYISARQILDRILRLPPGASLLVHGAAGGVGTALLDLGARAGLTLLGTASAGKHEILERFGAFPIDYRTEDFVAQARARCPGGVDAITDPIGGAHLLRSRQALRRGGILVAFGLTADVDAGIGGVLRNAGLWTRLGLTPGVRLRTYGFGVPPSSSRRACVRDWAWLMAAHADVPLHPVVGASLPFDRAPEAHDLVDRSAVAGKVILEAAA